MNSILERIRIALDPATAAGGFILFGLIGLAFLAAQLRSWRFGAAAIVGLTGWMSGMFLGGAIVIPVLVMGRRLRPNVVSRRVLVVSLVLGVVILALRLPWPTPMPGGATVRTEARVLHVQMVDKIFRQWVSRSRYSHERRLDYKLLPRPFDEVRFEVPASGSTPAAIVVDSVDHGSVDSLGMRPTVTVVMPVGSPGAARIADGGHTWPLIALIRWTASMYLWGAVWAALGIFVVRRLGRDGTVTA